MSTVSTTVNEVIVTGRKHRRLIDKAAKLWQRISYWTKACDVEFDDGRTAQEKIGAINGITSDFEEGAADIAASSVLTKKIKCDLNEGIINDRIQLVIDNDGNLGWKKDGADTVIPFSNGCELTCGSGSASISAPKKGMMVYAIMQTHHSAGGIYGRLIRTNENMPATLGTPGYYSAGNYYLPIPAGLTKLSSTWGWWIDKGENHHERYIFRSWWSNSWCVVWGPMNIKDYRQF